MGAHVDKCEEPGPGDYLRTVPWGEEGMNPAFRALNLGKRSIGLNLKLPQGIEAFKRLATHYHVLIEGFRPGVMDRLGIGYEALSKVNPALIYCAITGYGSTGPAKDHAGHDINFMARSGLLPLISKEPTAIGLLLADISAGMFATMRILTALLEARATGRGTWIDISACESVTALGLLGLIKPRAGITEPNEAGVLNGSTAVYHMYTTSDGRWLSFAAIEPKFWFAFCTAVGLEPDSTALIPGPHQATWKQRVQQIIGSKTGEEWEHFSKQHNCCLEIVLSPDEAKSDPQHQAREIFVDIENASLQMAKTPVTAENLETLPNAPTLGEHTDQILSECGFSSSEIAELKRSGIAG